MLRKEDKCQIEIIGEMTLERLASFHMLYASLLDKDAICLYETMLAIGIQHANISNHLLIINITRLSIEGMDSCRKKLEQFLLLKTFYHAVHNVYIYQLYMPKNGSEFLSHEVFGRYYMKEMGKQVYEFNKLCFAHQQHDKKDFQEITMPFENILKEDWHDAQERQFREMKPQQDIWSQNDIPLSFNFDLFLSGLSNMVFPLSARTGANLHAIGELATIHGISEKDMRKFVSQSMDLKHGRLQLDKLKRFVRNAKHSYAENDESNAYGLPPVIFLQKKQHGIKVSNSDKFLIETLITDFKMKPEVVNVLIEYVLKTSNQRFTRNYVEKVAGSWIRLKIDTKDKALALLQEEQGNPKQKDPVKKALPKWYENQDLIQEHVNEIDEDELSAKLKRLKGEEHGTDTL